MPPIASGDRYGRLTAISLAGRGPSGRQIWKFKCDCGKEVEVLAKQVRNGHNSSCGCYRRECLVERSKANATHGMTNSPEYHCWLAMRKRCGDPEHKSYARYGGRGISVCERWQDSFENFYADMGPRPSLQHTIERNDNDAYYNPQNCRWATKKEQARNRRSTVNLSVNGETICLTEAAERLGLRVDTVWRRLNKHGWTVEQLFDPAFAGKRHRHSGPHAAALRQRENRP